MDELSSKQLREMKDSFDLFSKYCSNALKVREELIKFNSIHSYDSKKNDSIFHPDSYYNFTCFDKGICITRDGCYIDDKNNFRTSRSGRYFYHIQTIGFKLPNVKEVKFYKLDTDIHEYYQFDSLSDSCINTYFHTVVKLLSDILHIDLQYNLDIF